MIEGFFEFGSDDNVGVEILDFWEVDFQLFDFSFQYCVDFLEFVIVTGNEVEHMGGDNGHR